MSSTKKVPHRAIIPNPSRSEDECRRFYHRDLDGPDYAGRTVTPRQLAAEAAVLDHWLSRRLFLGVLPRFIGCDPSESLTDHEWAEQRLTRIRHALRTGAGRRAA